MPAMELPPLRLAFEGGTVGVTGGSPELLATLPHVCTDRRGNVHRTEGRYYRPLVEHLRREKIPYVDEARGYPAAQSPWRLQTERQPFPHQEEAVAAWWAAGARGVVVL